MKKPELFRGDLGDYKYKLPFSCLCDLRDQGIDFFEINSINDYIIQEPRRLYPIIKVGVEYAEKRKLTEEELIEIVDDIVETLGFGIISGTIWNSIAIYIPPLEENVEETKEENTEKKQ